MCLEDELCPVVDLTQERRVMYGPTQPKLDPPDAGEDPSDPELWERVFVDHPSAVWRSDLSDSLQPFTGARMPLASSSAKCSAIRAGTEPPRIKTPSSMLASRA